MQKNTFLDLIVQKRFDEIKEDIGFSSNIFMVFGLPTRKLAGNPAYWKKKTSLCELTIMRHDKYEIPYGCYARMNQIYIDTEVKTKNTNVIDVGRSFNEYVKKVGYKEGKANKALLRQLINYITSVIRIEPVNPEAGRSIRIQSLVANAWDIFFDVKSPEQLTFSKGKRILNEDYARYIYKHSVPLDMNIVRCFKRNPLGLDFYRFLAYRNNELKKTISFPDTLLFEQLGTEEDNTRKTRMKLKGLLKLIQAYWPVKAKFEDGYFEFAPSVPTIQKKVASKKPFLEITKTM